MPKVWNKKYPHPKDAQYIGRPSILGNPYSHIKNSIAEFIVANVQVALVCFESYARKRMEVDPEFREAIKALKDKDIVCWCANMNGVTPADPLVCHGQILMKLCEELCGQSSASSSGASSHS